MLDSYYEAYLKNTFRFASRINIKFGQISDRINDELVIAYGTDEVLPNDKTSWKYYMNMAGEYHPRNTMMYITSLDTLETIEFTKANLVTHTATAAKYLTDDYYYRTLLFNYPEQDLLIRGILYPVDKQLAIDARDGTILAYDTTLVEVQEIVFVPMLQKYLFDYFDRWDVRGYYYTDSLYPAAFLGVLYTLLVSKCHNIRLSQARTPYAHSYHIREYLNSHHGVGAYYDYLTLEQKLLLYRNALWIEKHAGKGHNLKDLIEYCLTKRFMNIGEFDVRQLSTFNPDGLNDYWLHKRPLNALANVPSKDNYTVAEYGDKIQSNVIGGSSHTEYIKNNYYGDEHKVRTTQRGWYATKALETVVIDYTDSFPVKYTEVLMNEWINCIAHNKYTAYVVVTLPRTQDRITLSVKDAFIYMIYLYAKSILIDLRDIQPYIVTRVLRDPKATIVDIASMAPDDFTRKTQVATNLFNNTKGITDHTSVSSFNSFYTSVYDEHIRQWFMVSAEEDMNHRGYVESMVHHLYAWEKVHLTEEGTLYSTWLESKHIPDTQYTVPELQKLATDIYQEATGYLIDDFKKLRYVHKAMVDILRRFSSYTIQIIDSVIDSNLLLVDWAVPRPAIAESKGVGEVFIPIPVEIINIETTQTQLISIDLDKVSAVNCAIRYRTNIQIDPNLPVIHNTVLKFHEYISLAAISVINTNTTGNVSSLSTEQLNQLLSVYS